MNKILLAIVCISLFSAAQTAQSSAVQKPTKAPKVEIKTVITAETTKVVICDTVLAIKHDTTKFIYSLKDTVAVTKIDTVKTSKTDTLKTKKK